MKKLVLIILVVTLAFSMAACGEDTTKETTGDKTNSTATTAPSATAEPNGVGVIGQLVSCEDYKATLIAAKLYDKIPNDYGSDKPSDGNKFLVLFLEFENLSEDGLLASNLEEVSADDYSIDNAYIMANKVDGYDLLSVTINAGKKGKGFMVYEVPANFGEVEIILKKDLFSDTVVATYNLTPSDMQ